MQFLFVVDEGFSKVSILLRGLSLSLFDIFFQQEGVQELDVPLVLRLLRWFFCFLRQGSFHFVPCFLLFLGCFGLFMIGRMSSNFC
jgi:hypothetical protein